MKTILLIGAGRMGSAMLSGWLKGLDMSAHFMAIDPNNKPNIGDLVEYPLPGKQFTYFKSPSEVPKHIKADAVILATKPQMVADAVKSVRAYVGPNTVLASVAAGVPTETIKTAIPGHPAAVRIMPNIGAMVGHSVSAGFASAEVTPDQKSLINKLFAAIGVFSWLASEDDLHTVTALSGSGPAYYFALCEAMVVAAQEQGLAEEVARNLAIGTIVAAGRLLEQTPDPTHLRKTVTSPNGTTAAGLEALGEDDALVKLAQNTINAAHKRSIELA
ncbi:pyrroline-5-carboxylate reductase [Cognatishimia sp. WU-CL00825]|uniref:pyrroline-5-carboxylate reductase n=1 Tax=Cognatishimia sp. WU-CL00825 TaxID=3127658 RepID=UPI0031084790